LVKLPGFLAPLFWDYPPGSIDIETHAPFVLERVLEYGSLEAARWVLATYGPGRVGEFLRRRGVRVLSRKTLSLWTVLLGLEGEECFAASSLSRSRPSWNY
jgi:hypothetical protein